MGDWSIMGDSAPTPAKTLVGRHRELRDAGALVESGLAGSGALLLVSGEAGIGKTRLVEELAAGLGGTGLVLWGTCWDDPGAPPFGPWAKVVRDAASRLGLGPGPGLAPIFGGSEATEGPPGQLRLRLYESVTAFLRDVSRRQPLLIVIEDLHFAHAPSLHLLRYLAASLRGHPVAMVATYRDPDLSRAPALTEAAADLVSTGRRLPLLGLDREAVAELMSSTTHRVPDDGLVTHMLERTGGNPLFVIETSRLLATRGQVDGGALPIASSVRQVIGHRLAYVSGDALAVLGAAAVVGQVFPEAVVRRVSGESPSRVADLLTEAVDAGLVYPTSELGQFAFTHALVRDVLYAGMPAPLRRSRHRLVAEAIEALHPEDVDDHVGALADHYVLAMPDVDIGRVLPLVRGAAERALTVLAYEEAARQFGRAVELARSASLDEGQRVELLLALGDARLRAGDWPAATAVYDEVATMARRRGRPDELARAALGMGAGFSGFEVRLFDHHQIELLREALDNLDDGEMELRAWVLSRLVVAESFVVDDELRIRRSRDAVDIARRSRDPRLLVHALSSYCDAIPGPDHTEERLAVATEMIQLGEQSGQAESELLGRRFRVVARLEAGDIAGVDGDVAAFERGAARLRWPLLEWYPPLWRGMRAVIEGRLGDAKRFESEARRIGQRAGSVNAAILADVLRLQRLVEEGRSEDAHRLLDRFLADPEGGPNAEAWSVLVLARTGRRAEGRALLDRLVATGFPLVKDGAWLEVIASVAEGCAELGHREAAQRLTDLIEPYAGRFATGGIGAICMGSMARHLGLLAHCAGALDEADRYFRAALDAHRRAGAALLIAHTQRQHAALLLDRDEPGDCAEATAMLAVNAETYRQLGLDHWMPEQPAREPAPATTSHNALHRDGDVWSVRFNGQEARIHQVKGLAVIARLLAEPGREFHVSDLAGEGDAQAASVARSGGTGQVLDDRARREFRRRLQDLEADIEEATAGADRVRAEKAEIERDALVTQLAAAYGLRGRARDNNDPTERARWTVTKQIHNAIDRIGKVHPPLARHLANSVSTGRYCVYAPEATVAWNIKVHGSVRLGG